MVQGLAPEARRRHLADTPLTASRIQQREPSADCQMRTGGYAADDASFCTTSPGSGKRPSWRLEKISCEPLRTSKTPPLLLISLTSLTLSPKACLSSAAKLAARLS